MEGGREGGMEGGREGEREEGMEGGREGGRRDYYRRGCCVYVHNGEMFPLCSLVCCFLLVDSDDEDSIGESEVCAPIRMIPPCYVH